MKHINRMLIEANLSSLSMTLISWSLCSHLVGLGHRSVIQWRPKNRDRFIIDIGNKLYISFGLKKLAEETWQ